MPRRGERRARPAVRAPVQPDRDRMDRVGVRVLVDTLRGRTHRLLMDPAGYRCGFLVAQLADEAVEYATKMALASPTPYSRAVKSFGAFVDNHLGELGPDPGAARLDGAEIDLVEIIFAWEGMLRQEYGLQSVQPYRLAGALLQLIHQRAARDRRVPDKLRRRASGPPSFPKPRTPKVLDEFSNSERLALQETARADVRALEKRLARGLALLQAGVDPRQGGWREVPNLIWEARRGTLRTVDLNAHLPKHSYHWPAPLLEVMKDWPGPYRGGQALMRSIARQLFPDEMDLHAFRVLLLLAMHDTTPEELHGLRVADIEFADGGVRVVQTKLRASRIRADLHTEPLDAEQQPAAGQHEGRKGDRSAEPVWFGGSDPWSVPGLLRRLMAVTQLTREVFQPEPWLFIAVGSGPKRSRLNARLVEWRHDGLRFTHWIDSHRQEDGSPALSISQPHNVRRLRKTAKTTRAVALGGTLTDLAADDHHVEVFRSHYAHGTTAHVLAGRTINRVQERVFARISKPLFIDADAEQRLADPPVADVVGLSVERATAMSQGQYDMGLTNCRDPHDSPFTAAGKPCHVAPAMCMLCRNAVVFTSQLPRLLLLADHIERMQAVLEPTRWTAIWGQQAAALAELFAECQDLLPAARQAIEDEQIRLDLPLGMRTEYFR